MKSRVFSLILAVLTLIPVFAFVTGCSNTSNAAKRVNNLKIGVLPTVSALPLFVADKEGYFKDEGLNVDLVNFNSALEQDAALQAKGIDGYFSDPVNAITMINGGVDVSIINSPYVSSSTDRMFAILVSPGSNIDSAAKLSGVAVGIADATITEYLQDKMLESAGLTQSEIVGQDIKQIPVRLQLLLSGQVKAALLPEPMVTLAESKGAKAVIDDTVLNCPETVIALNNSLMKEDTTLQKRFLQALDKAANYVNSNPGDLMDIISANINIADEIKSIYKIPRFPVNALPSEEQINEIQKWLIDKDIIAGMLPYDRIIK